MAKKQGSQSFSLGEAYNAKLEGLSKKTGICKTEILRRGINLMCNVHKFAEGDKVDGK